MSTAARSSAAAPWHGRLVLVAGLGVSGMAAAQALLDRGARVRVADAGDDAPLRERAETLRAAGAEVRLGVANPEPDLDVDLVVVSPGLADSSPLLAPALAAGTPVWSEAELAWRCNEGRTRLVAVTGTNGKTTTTQLLARCLDAPAAGNIGTALVTVLGAHDPPPLVVAELSSFQLQRVSTLRPDVAVLLNLAPDHLDRHGSMAAYGLAKARIWARQRAQDWAVVDTGDPATATLLRAAPPPGRRAGFTLGFPAPACAGIVDGTVVWRSPQGKLDPVVEVEVLDASGLRGPHNRGNVAAAVAAAVCAGADPSSLRAAIESFRLGGHRLAQVASVDGVDYVDDSKATNPHAAAAAVASFPHVVWIAGGLAKGLGVAAFEALSPLLAQRARAVVTIGTSGPDIAAFARGLGLPTVEAGTLEAAVPLARDLAQAGDTVLLAPACASMDQFTDYAHRGRRFVELVAALGGRPAATASADSADSTRSTHSGGS